MLKFVTENSSLLNKYSKQAPSFGFSSLLPISTWRQAPYCKIPGHSKQSPQWRWGLTIYQRGVMVRKEKGPALIFVKLNKIYLRFSPEREEWLSTWASQCRRGEKYVTSKWKVMLSSMRERNRANSLEQIISVGIIITREWEWVKASLKKEQLNLRGSESQAS